MKSDIGDIVQITDESHHWYPCLIIVTEVKSWGIQGYITIPSNDNNPNGNAFIRLKDGEFEFCGCKAVLVRGTGEEDRENGESTV
jgi:hypothetical protein